MSLGSYGVWARRYRAAILLVRFETKTGYEYRVTAPSSSYLEKVPCMSKVNCIR